MKTKFFAPMARSRMIGRHSLLELGQSVRLPKLTLVAAPAGFGKTTMLVQWRGLLQDKGVTVAWLTLGMEDRSTTALLRGIVESMQFASPSFGQRTGRIIDSSARFDVTSTLNDLVDDIAETARPMVLFLDDYHCISNADTDELIELLLNLAPSNFQMIIASRIRPQFGLAALRVQDELQEITLAHLRFNLSEAAEFLTKIRRLELSNEQVAKIHEHSEGWVAGLQLASLSLRDPDRRDDFIDSFSGSLQDIAEYLASDVLSQQPEHVQEFLLRTSVVERMSGDLAAELTGVENAQEQLEKIARDGLFVTPMDQEHVWYRYHQLFHEFLLTELRRRHPGEVVRLYCIASRWFESHGLSGEAVEYGLLAGDFDNVTALVEQQSWQELMAGHIPQVIAWIQRIPDSVRNENPKLLYLLGTALYHSNRADESEGVLSILAEIVDNIDASCVLDDAEYLREQVRLLTAGVAIARDDPKCINEILSHEFVHLNNFERGLACSFRGYALAEFAEFGKAATVLREARRFHLVAGSDFGVVYVECFLALTDFANGNLDRCYARFSTNSTNTLKEKYIAPVPQVIKGIVLYQWNRIDEALECLRPNLPLIGEVGFTKLLVFGYTALARISGLRGDHRAAMRCYDLIADIGARWGAPYERHRSLVEGGRIAYLLQSDRLNEAIDHALSNDIDVDAESWPLPAQWERVSCRKALTWARLQIATNRPENTLPVLAELRRLATESRRGMRVLECFILEARARFDQDKERALDLIDEALEVATPNRSVRCFVDEGREIDSLLLDSQGGEIDSWPRSKRSFLEAIMVSIAHENATADFHDTESTGAVRGLIEPISEREREILNLIANGSTNKVISAELFISNNTVKWHLKNIFGKLGVSNRTSAVATARQLELLA